MTDVVVIGAGPAGVLAAMTWQLHPSANGRIGMASPQPPVKPAEAHDRKGRKREAKRRRDAQRLPDSYERFKILLEVIGKGATWWTWRTTGRATR